MQKAEQKTVPQGGDNTYKDLFLKSFLGDDTLQSLLKALGGHADTVRVVGGAVRNALRDTPQGDLDVATIHEPKSVISLLKRAGFKTYPTGVGHGTITAVSGDFSCEITTLREDISTDGRHAEVRFGTDWQADAERRDFTMNALSVDSDGTLYDLVDGLQDCLTGRVRFIGDAAQRMAEDHLRGLRFFRFSAHYGDGAPDPVGLAAVEADQVGLSHLSPERVRVELLKWFSAPSATQLQRTVSSALEIDWFPLDEPSGQALCDLHACERPDPIVRLACLFHDQAGDCLIKAKSLRFSNAELDRLKRILAALRLLSEGETPLLAAYHWGADHAADALYLHKLLASEPLLRTEMPENGAEWSVPVFPLSGADLMAVGFPAGPRLGKALSHFEAEWLASGFELSRNTLLAQARSRLSEMD